MKRTFLLGVCLLSIALLQITPLSAECPCKKKKDFQFSQEVSFSCGCGGGGSSSADDIPPDQG